MVVYLDRWNFAVHEGDAESCRNFVCGHMETLSDGRKLYRTWTENGKYYIDAGIAVFYTLEPLFEN